MNEYYFGVCAQLDKAKHAGGRDHPSLVLDYPCSGSGLSQLVTLITDFHYIYDMLAALGRQAHASKFTIEFNVNLCT